MWAAYILGVLFLLTMCAPPAGAAEVFGRDQSTTDAGAEQCMALSGLTGSWYFRATAWDAEGNQSVLSNEVLKTDPTQVCWANPTENVDGSSLTDLTKVTIYYSSEPIVGGSTDQQVPLPDTPIALVGTALPEERSVTLSLAYVPAGDLRLSLTVNDADVGNEGFLRAGPWEAQLFQGQTGPDAQDHVVEYVLPRSVVDNCEVVLTFEHTATAGYTIQSGQISYVPEASCEMTPPTLVEQPVLRIR